MGKLNFEKAIQTIKNGNRFAIFIHLSPDGDCVGAAKSLECLLNDLNKESFIICEDKPTFSTTFLCNSFTDDEELVNSADTIICVDISGAKRVGKYSEFLMNTDKPVIVIDHHHPQDDFGTIICRDEQASSATELVYDLFQEMDYNISSECATYLYAGISSDTGSFIQPNTNPSTLEAASNLMKLGADTTMVNNELFVKRPSYYMDVLKLVIHKLEIYEDKLSLVVINNRTYKKFKDLNTFYIVDALKYYTTDALVIVTQKDKNTVKINARSRNYDVQKLCAKFGGGGHTKASGATTSMKLKDVVKQIKKEILG